MRRLVVHEWMSLDGVVQAPGTPDEDTRNGFAHGGWHVRHFDDRGRAWELSHLQDAGAFLFGRRTYETFAAFWPHAGEAEQVIARPLTEKPKYVVSTTLRGSLPWANSSVLAGDLGAAVKELKQQDGGDIHVIGSIVLARSLTALGLVDEYQFMIDPVVLGGGLRLFEDDGVQRPLELTHSETLTTGAILTTYRPA